MCAMTPYTTWAPMSCAKNDLKKRPRWKKLNQMSQSLRLVVSGNLGDPHKSSHSRRTWSRGMFLKSSSHHDERSRSRLPGARRSVGGATDATRTALFGVVAGPGLGVSHSLQAWEYGIPGVVESSAVGLWNVVHKATAGFEATCNVSQPVGWAVDTHLQAPCQARAASPRHRSGSETTSSGS
jgi:hypothetical protein